MDRLIQSPLFQAIPDGATLLAPSLWENTHYASIPDPHWGKYVLYRTGKRLRITGDFHECCFDGSGRFQPPEKLYYVGYGESVRDSNEYILLSPVSKARIEEGRLRVFADSFYLLSYSRNRRFMLHANSETKQESPLVVGGKLAGFPEEPERIRLKFPLEPTEELFVGGEFQYPSTEVSSLLLSYYSDFQTTQNLRSPASGLLSCEVRLPPMIVMKKKDHLRLKGEIVNRGNRRVTLRGARPPVAEIYPSSPRIESVRLASFPVTMEKSVLLPGESSRFYVDLDLNTPLFGYFQLRMKLLPLENYSRSISPAAPPSATLLLVVKKEERDNR